MMVMRIKRLVIARRTTLPILISVLALSSTVFAGCSSSASPAAPASPPAKQPLVLASVVALTGADGTFGVDFSAGLHAEINLVNKAGGVLGRQLEYKVIDDGSDANKAALAAHTLLSGSPTPFAIWGGAGSVDSLPVIPIAAAAQVVSIMSNGTPGAGDGAKNPYNFTNYQGTGDSLVMPTAVAQVGGADAKVGILETTDSSSVAQGSAVEAALKAAGVKVVGTQTANPAATDFTSQLSALRSDGSTVIYEKMANSPETSFLMDSLQTLGWNSVKIIGSDNALSAQVFQTVPQAVAGQLTALAPRALTYTSTGGQLPPNVKALITAAKAVGGDTSNLLETFLGADAVTLLVHGLELAKSADPQKLRSALETLGKNPVTPQSQLFVDPPLQWTVSNHCLAFANQSSFYSLARPGKIVDGIFPGTPVTVTKGPVSTTVC
jgi:branched-chain amino acid transport system substrate-binding protein